VCVCVCVSVSECLYVHSYRRGDDVNLRGYIRHVRLSSSAMSPLQSCKKVIRTDMEALPELRSC